ncbi:MAG TPA: hypothetical protein DCG12_23680 [Planctomycetaceae bacterium]|nr:hypothetical protein [Planctomycetaceae bacterium]
MAEFSVSQSIVVDKDPETVFDAVADFGTWSPWLIAEPDAKVTVTRTLLAEHERCGPRQNNPEPF